MRRAQRMNDDMAAKVAGMVMNGLMEAAGDVIAAACRDLRDSRPKMPETIFFAGILSDALHDWMTRPKSSKEWKEVRRWINGNGSATVTFKFTCEALGLEPSCVKKKFLAYMHVS